MTKLEILRYPDERLRLHATVVTEVNSLVIHTIEHMLVTLYAAQGIGLAATQVNIHQQIMVIDISESRDQPLVLINPQLIVQEGTTAIEEGCLSIPGVQALVPRAAYVKVEALNIRGEPYEIEARDLLAICIQHELDHLQGKLFIDRLSPLKRQRLQRKYDKKNVVC